MARIRSVKPEFWSDDKIGRLSPYARLLFIALWNFSDDHGVISASTRRILGECFENDPGVTEKMVGKLLAEIEAQNLVVRFSCDGKEWLYTRNWSKHQKVEKISGRRNPKPPTPLLSAEDSPKVSPTPPRHTPPLDMDMERDSGRGEGEGSSRASEFKLPVRSEEAVALAAERKVSGGMTQAVMDRALVVLNLYPGKAKKDGRVIAKTLADQNALAVRIANNPDHPWEEHARLVGLSSTPADLRKWIETMPDPIAFASLQEAAPKVTAKANPAEFHLDYQPPEDDAL